MSSLTSSPGAIFLGTLRCTANVHQGQPNKSRVDSFPFSEEGKRLWYPPRIDKLRPRIFPWLKQFKLAYDCVRRSHFGFCHHCSFGGMETILQQKLPKRCRACFSSSLRSSTARSPQQQQSSASYSEAILVLPRDTLLC